MAASGSHSVDSIKPNIDQTEPSLLALADRSTVNCMCSLQLGPTAPRSATKLLQSFQYTNPTLNQLTFLVVSRLTFSPQPHPSSSIESSPSRQAGSTRLAQEIQPASSQCSLHPNFWDAPLMASSLGPCGLLDPCPPLSSPLATSPGPPPGTIIAWAPAQCAECRVADSAEFSAAQ